MSGIIPWLNDNLINLMTVASLVICAFIFILMIAWLGGIYFKLCHWGATRRLSYLKVTSESKVLLMRHKRHAQDDSRVVEELKSVRSELAAAASREKDLRRLHGAQEELLESRQNKCLKMEEDIQNLRDGVEEMDEVEAALRAEVSVNEKENKRLIEMVETQELERNNHEQIIRLLEGQLSAQRKAADMANAGMADLQKEIGILRERVR